MTPVVGRSAVRVALVKDHDDFGSNRSKIIKVIDSQSLERDFLRKPLRTFRYHALALALLTGACATGESALTTAAAPPPDAGLWKFEKRTDPSTGAPMMAAYLNVNAFDSWGHLRSGVLQLMCFRREPVVRVAFNVKVGSNRSATLAWRFDERTGREATVRFLSD